MSLFRKAVIALQRTDHGCWEVTSHKADDYGYPQIKLNGKARRLHRAVYEQEYGVLTEDQVVRHICDNRLCVNPRHLTVGTHADNVADRVARGRCARGIANGRAKLDEASVKYIRKSSLGSAFLARCYGVDIKTLIAARTGRTWAHVK